MLIMKINQVIQFACTWYENIQVFYMHMQIFVPSLYETLLLRVWLIIIYMYMYIAIVLVD